MFEGYLHTIIIILNHHKLNCHILNYQMSNPLAGYIILDLNRKIPGSIVWKRNICEELLRLSHEIYRKIWSSVVGSQAETFLCVKDISALLVLL